MAKVNKKKPVPRRDPWIPFLKGSAMVMSKVGMIGFIVIGMTFYIFNFVPQEKKNELTDTWLLFKCKECSNIYIIVFVTLAALVLIQNYFYRSSIKQKDERIKEIAKEKSILQEQLLNKNLESSKTKKP